MSTRQKFMEDSYVNCPYYRKEAPVEIRCEGMCGVTTTHYFTSGAHKEDFKEDFCSGYYWNCPCYIALDENNAALR